MDDGCARERRRDERDARKMRDHTSSTPSFGWMNQLAKCGKVGLFPQVLHAQEGRQRGRREQSDWWSAAAGSLGAHSPPEAWHT